MKVKVLSSGSRGNVTAVNSGGKIILIDCGKPINWTLANLGYKLPDAILITHEHGDHWDKINGGNGIVSLHAAGRLQQISAVQVHDGGRYDLSTCSAEVERKIEVERYRPCRQVRAVRQRRNSIFIELEEI